MQLALRVWHRRCAGGEPCQPGAGGQGEQPSSLEPLRGMANAHHAVPGTHPALPTRFCLIFSLLNSEVFIPRNLVFMVNYI